MLNNIPFTFTPDLLKLMMEMGHGEELLIADANYPVCSTGAAHIPRIYVTSADIGSLLADILKFFPLDYAVEKPAVVMESAGESDALERYEKIIGSIEGADKIETVERFAFYELAASAVGIIATADVTKGANILLKKGVVN